MFSSKKPRFRFSLTLNDLSKIPHTSGHCYVELSVTDGSGSGFRAALASMAPFSTSKSPSSSENRLSPVVSNGNTQNEHHRVAAHSSSRCVQIRSARYKIHNFKCHFNFSMSCNLKFSLKRKDNMVDDKTLEVRVLYVAETQSRHERPHELGVVKLNLAEYLNFSEPVSARYLLQESKINSILHLTISLEELPPDVDFHTQLRIEDARVGGSSGSGSGSGEKRSVSGTNITRASGKDNTSYNVPSFSRHAVFGGLDGVINPQAAGDAGSGSPQKSSDSKFSQDDERSESRRNGRSGTGNTSGSSRNSRNRHRGEQGGSRKSRKSQKSSRNSGSEDENEDDAESGENYENRAPYADTRPIEDVIVDPVIGSLYRKILESTWDPDLHVLLKLTPEKVVDDILVSHTDPTRFEDNLEQYRRLRPPPESTGAGAGKSSKNSDGLVVASKFRPDLTSWSVSWA